jgi:hypothetical protein
MSRAKPIRCPRGPKPFDGCGTICKEVGHLIGYPKLLFDHPKKTYREYRYVCPKCGKEWLYDTSERGITPIPEFSQWKISIKRGKEITRANPKHPNYRESVEFLNQISKKGLH